MRTTVCRTRKIRSAKHTVAEYGKYNRCLKGQRRFSFCIRIFVTNFVPFIRHMEECSVHFITLLFLPHASFIPCSSYKQRNQRSGSRLRSYHFNCVVFFRILQFMIFSFDRIMSLKRKFESDREANKIYESMRGKYFRKVTRRY
jgi:hypothetical protein